MILKWSQHSLCDMKILTDLLSNVILGSPNGVKDIEHLHAWWCEPTPTQYWELVKTWSNQEWSWLTWSWSSPGHSLITSSASARTRPVTSTIRSSTYKPRINQNLIQIFLFYLRMWNITIYNLFLFRYLSNPLPLMIAYSTALFLVWKNNLWMSYLNSNLHSFKQILLVLWVENNMFAFYKWMECCQSVVRIGLV